MFVFPLDWRQSAWLLAACSLGLVLNLMPLEPLVLLTAAVLFALLLIAIIHQPLVGLALALLVGPFGALESFLLGGNVPLDSGQLFLFLTLGAWGAKKLAQRDLSLPKTPLTLPLLLFMSVMFLTILDAPSLRLGLFEILKWAEVLLVMLLIVDLRPENGRIASYFGWVLALVLLPALLQSVLGVWQFAIRGDGPAHFLLFGRFYRAYGTFHQPNPFGGFIGLNAALAVGVALGLLTAAFNQRRKSLQKLWSLPQWPWLLLMLTCAAVLVAGLISSWSRGAWLGFAAAFGALILFWPRTSWRGLLLASTLLFVGLLAWQYNWVPSPITERLSTVLADYRPGDVRGVDINDANYAVLERLAFWQSAVNMARDQVWLGVGFGNYAAAYSNYALINWEQALGHAHNYYFNLLAETGVIGLLAYLLLWTAVFAQSIILLRRLDWPSRGIALGLLAVWVALSVHHLVDKLYVNNIYVHLGAMLGLQQILENTMNEENS